MIYSHLFNVHPHLWWKEINMDPNQNKKNDKNNRGRMRGVASLILWALVLVRLLVPVSLPGADFSVLSAAEPVGRTRSFPTGRDTSS